MNIESFLNRIWYKRLSIWAILLWPLSMLFALLANLNKLLYRSKIKPTIKLPVPVIVVGNITVGGTGKTPLTVYLAQELTQLGWNVGIVSRGYARTEIDKDSPQEVTPHSNPAEVGDEPLLLARGTGVPVFVARQRAVAGQALLAAHPSVNVLLCDDGLQHYALARDLELCVIDGARGLGNGLRLPAGPLREARARLKTVDAIVLNGNHCLDWLGEQYPPQYALSLQAQACYQLTHPNVQRTAIDFAGETLTAMPGIGNPARFFATLRDLGFRFAEQAMPDHHAFSVQDLPASGAIIVTEKDAVKLSALNLGADGDRIWVLPVAAQIEPNLADWLDEQLRKL
ncbi:MULTISPECIES: tetraacyldisaccharide 4'-kinase [Deefgea]|uniref:Tetraacyldisaccharide 4'-kinase n=1 Tax=Deefgea chitinilytica TaxID=570276 RepID=A0ABS2CBB4_9NEIS|nr:MULTISPECIES: tetraacyldisaccharide 4'-kinase [Deefgea]MBM5570925.1 tetraacyldisaccharide 4'-kinase [Deefgea chitinilytica]MBM9888154.1 tetraacyldisaccharide 4'-kinase [Deefgea sp. CFH1-16]